MPWLNACFTGGLIAYLAGTAAGIAGFRVPRRARIGVFGCALAGALLEIIAAVVSLARGGITTWNLPSGVPLFSWTIRVNALSAYFNLTLGILAAAVSVYSFGYLRQMEGRRNIGVLGCFYNILLLSLTLVFAAGNAFFFLVAWEIMALAAWGLVSFEHEKERTRRAGMLFLIMSHAGSGLLVPHPGEGQWKPRFRDLSPPCFGASGLAARRGVPAVLSRIRREGGSRPAACLAPGGPSRGAQ